MGHILYHLETSSNRKQAQQFLEIGCGSGAISVSLLKEFRQVQTNNAIISIPLRTLNFIFSLTLLSRELYIYNYF